MVESGDVKSIPRLSLQDGVFHPGILKEVGITGGDASDLGPRYGQLGDGERPDT